jgi:hypothetical protein
MNTIRPGGVINQMQWAQLQTNLMASAAGPVRPNDQSVNTLTSGLMALLSQGNLTPQQRGQLAVNVNMLMNSSALSPAERQVLIQQSRAIIPTNSVNPQIIRTLESGMLSIAGDFEQTGGATGQTGQPLPPPAGSPGVIDRGQSQIPAARNRQ